MPLRAFAPGKVHIAVSGNIRGYFKAGPPNNICIIPYAAGISQKVSTRARILLISQISRIPLISRILSFAFASGASNIGMYQCRASPQTNSYEVYLRYPRYKWWETVSSYFLRKTNSKKGPFTGTRVKRTACVVRYKLFIFSYRGFVRKADRVLSYNIIVVPNPH